MANLVRAASRAEIPAGTGKLVELGGKSIALFNLESGFCAIDNTCAHRGGPLSEGAIEGSSVTCPWHGWQYDCTTGKCINVPGKGVACYPVKVQGNDVMVEIG